MAFRLRAFSIHLGISFIIAALSLVIVFWIWHPSPLEKAVDVTHVFLLLLAIDTILGPILTFLIAKKDKKTLKLDLTIIALLQVSAYCYGMYHIAEGRPSWIAFDTMRFELITANAIDNSDADMSYSLEKPTWFSPKLVAVRSPQSNQEKSNRLFL